MLVRQKILSDLAAILEEEDFGAGVFATVKPDRAVAADMIGGHAATGAPSVHLGNAETIAARKRGQRASALLFGHSLTIKFKRIA